MFLVGLFVALAVLFVALVARIEKRRRETFEARFPPISDEEFLARCTPGVRPEIALKVRRVLSEALNVDEERIYPSSRLVEDLGAE
jgi:hypothetical protein